MKQRSIITLIFLSFVLLSQGQSFGEKHTVTSGNAGDIKTILHCDTDADGDIDILISTSSKIFIIENLGDNTYSELRVVMQDMDNPSVMITLDVNNDGLQDLVFNYKYNNHEIWWAKNLGNNEFTLWNKIVNSDPSIAKIESHDFNNDGFQDIIYIDIGNDYELHILLNNGNTTFTELGELLSYTMLSYQCYDFDNDNDLDIFYYGSYGSSCGFLINDGNASFETELFYNNPDDKLFVAKSFDSDNDGDMDILLGSIVDSTLYLYVNNGNNEFNQHYEILNTNNYRNLIFLDIDKDSLTDIIRLGTGFSVLKNQGNYSFTLDTTEYANWFGGIYKKADIDNDGWTDMLIGTGSYGGIAWVKNIEGKFNNELIQFTSDVTSVYSVDAEDINNDGLKDIFVEDHYYTTTFFINQGLGEFSGPYRTPKAYRNSGDTFFSDVDNDGYSDIITYSDRVYDLAVPLPNVYFGRNNKDLSFDLIPYHGLDKFREKRFYEINADNDSTNEYILFNTSYVDTIFTLELNNNFSFEFADTVVIDSIKDIDKIYFTDFDQNGQKDIVISKNDVYLGTGNYTDIILLYLSNNNIVNYYPDTLYSRPWNYHYNMTVAEVNGNSFPDILCSTTEGLIWLENKDGFIIEEHINYLDYENKLGQIQPIDANGDGYDEIIGRIVNNYERIVHVSNITRDSLIITYHDYTTCTCSDFNKCWHIADMDADGDIDFLSGSRVNSDISWLENNFIHASVEENETNNSLLVYPNPAGESINIKLGESATQDYEILLYNNLGMEINRFRAEARQTQITINTKNLKPGIYYVVLKSGNNISTSKVVIVE